MKTIINKLIIFIFIFWTPGLCLAQQIPFDARENMIIFTLTRLQDKEEAIKGSIEDAQIKIMEEGSTKVSKRPYVLPPTRPSRRGTFNISSHPYLDYELKSDDNIDTNTKYNGSIIHTTKPGLKMNFMGRRKNLNLDMYVKDTAYNNRSRLNLLEAEMDALANFVLGHYTISIGNDYYNNHIGQPHFGIKKNENSHYWKNAFNTKIGRHFNRMDFDFEYERADYDYEPDYSDEDRTEETFNFNQYLRIATKTQLLFGYERKWTKYRHLLDASSDYNHNDFSLNLTGVLSPRISGLFGIAYRLGDYKASDDYRKTTFTGQIGYRISDRSDMSLSLERIIDEYGDGEAYYNENKISLLTNHRLAFNPKLNLSFSYVGDMFTYPKKAGTTQKERTNDFTLGLDYAFRIWLDFSLDYKYSRTDYNYDDDYGDTTVTFKTQARF